MSDQRPFDASPSDDDARDEHVTEVIPNPYAGASAAAGPALTPPPPPPPPLPADAAATPAGAGSGNAFAGPPPMVPAGGPKPKGSGGMGKVVATAAAVSVLLGGISGYAGYTLAAKTDTNSPTATSGNTAISIPAENLSPRAGDSIADIADRMLPTVVSIEESGSSGTGTGSGFIVRSDGYIVTNNHVVEGAAGGGTIRVQFDDGSIKQAEIVGRNPSYDIAVLKVDASDLPVASIGNSNDLEVGDTVVAVGSPLGLSGTVTSGIVSATNRPVTAGGSGETSYINAIQTDAAINPGNSGGPLVNAAAEVIGVNSAIASLGSDVSGQAGSIGLGFAIPSNTMKRIVDEIINTGQASTPVIGVNLSPESDSGDGAVVGSVVSGGPAAAAGIKAGDVITEVNGTPTPDAVALITQVRSFAPGEEVTLTVQSDGSEREVKVTLGSKSD